jgi:hypothetical protein
MFETNISRTISVHINRDLIISLMMGTEIVLKTSVSYRHLTQLIAREDFMKLYNIF